LGNRACRNARPMSRDAVYFSISIGWTVAVALALLMLIIF
jgi:hypothetical protein